MARPRLLWQILPLLLLLPAIGISIALPRAGEQIKHFSAKCSSGDLVLASNQTVEGSIPASGVRYEAVNRRRLGDFRECAPCTCCTDQSRKYCFLTGCCYSINCSLRRVPFGLCSFTPVSCNCFGCS